jgi:hypothetical protein
MVSNIFGPDMGLIIAIFVIPVAIVFAILRLARRKPKGGKEWRPPSS